MHIGFWLEIQKETDHWEKIEADGKIILKWNFEEQNEVVWSGFIWLRIGTSGGLM
jgi:hypothetical protein